METWIDTSGDDVWRVMDEGRLLPSRPLAFGGPRFLYAHDGAVLEITPTIHDGHSAWKITRRTGA